MIPVAFDRVGKRYRRSDLRRAKSPVRWAVRDLSLHVEAGETVGLIGINGAGKSTALRLAIGVTTPTEGTVSTKGRLAGVLSLGEGFHPLLTGRENAVTGAMLSGFSYREAKKRLRLVREFSGLEDAFDDPVRTYSSGMFVRLAFAVAMNVDADVLLIDEALAVGDLEFASLCIAHLLARQRSGTTMLVASHNLEQVRKLCHRVAWLDGGTIAAVGDPDQVIGTYQRALHTPGVPAANGGTDQIGSHEVEFRNITVLSGDRDLGGVLPVGWPMTVAMSWTGHVPVESMIFGVSIHDEFGTRLVDISSPVVKPRVGENEGIVKLQLERLDLGGGRYHLDVGIYDDMWQSTYDYRWQAAWFEVPGAKSSGPLHPPHRWEATN